jgi:AcrR family transcriptional regulator
MVDPKVKREQTIRDTKSNLILEAAGKVFCEKGFHETRLEDIAAAAGFSKASLYNYYNDKEEIFISLAVRDFNGLLEVLRTHVNQSTDFMSTLERMIRTVFGFFGEHFAFLLEMHNFRTLTQLTQHSFSRHHQQMAHTFISKSQEIIELYAGLLKEARCKGEIATRLDEKAVSSYIGSIVRGVLIDWKIRGGMGDAELEIGQILEFVSYGLGYTRAVPARKVTKERANA